MQKLIYWNLLNLFIKICICKVTIVTLKTEGNTTLSKLLNKGFERPIHWNEYKAIPEKIYAANENLRY